MNKIITELILWDGVWNIIIGLGRWEMRQRNKREESLDLKLSSTVLYRVFIE